MKRTRITHCSHCQIFTSCVKVDREFFCTVDAGRAKLALKIYLREVED